MSFIAGGVKETSQPENFWTAEKKSTAEQQEHGKIINNFKILIIIFAIQMFLFFLRSFAAAEKKGLAVGKSEKRRNDDEKNTMKYSHLCVIQN